MRFRHVTYGVALLALAVTPAAAAPLLFTLSGFDVNRNNEVEYASFTIDSHPTVLANNYSLGNGFRVKFVPGVYQYGTTVATLQDVQFSSDASFDGDTGDNYDYGGFFTVDPTLTPDDPFRTIIFVDGIQLYTGPENAPTLLTGNFTVFDGYDGSPLSLSITEAVPEPATWSLMMAGFGLVGYALRRRPQRAVVRFA